METRFRGKISMMDDECQMKLQETTQKIVNDNNGGMGMHYFVGQEERKQKKHLKM